MSSSGVGTAARGSLTERQAETVARLVETAHGVLVAGGYDGLTVRTVASAAGVAPATAYTYFASKDHLIAEVFWRRLREVPGVDVDQADPPATRVAAALSPVAAMLVGESSVAGAVTTAMLASDPEVRRVRDRIGAALQQRVTDALGADADPAVVRLLGIIISGTMLQAGMGHLSYEDLPGTLAEAAELLLGSADR
ncbi:MAG: TetR/AcrR family transcriptional regulator [Acidimicrobiales bacterium]|nr:TetR/AcrR family transcriptional regulator [Acidimicrobiales bacterium]